MNLLNNTIKEIAEYIEKYLAKYEFEEKAMVYKGEIEKIYYSTSEDIQCFMNKVKSVQGVLVIDDVENKWVLIADNERVVRDLIRHVPENVEYTCYFEQKYGDIIMEYVFLADGAIPGGYSVQGYRGSCITKENVNNSQEAVLSSKKHPIVCEIKENNSLSGRIKSERIIVEGMRLVKRALEDGLPVENVIYTAGNEADLTYLKILCNNRKISCYKTTPGIMSAMTTTHPVPEVICTVRHKIRSQKNLILSSNKNFYLILDGISNPDNLGIILRTVDAAGINGVILLSNSTHYMNKNAIRGARGAIGRIPIYFADDDKEVFHILKKEEFKIIGTSARFESSNFYDIDYNYRNIAVVIGNESDGIRKEILEYCTEYLKIPMAEGQSSLNIAVAAALIMYEYVRNVVI